MKTLILVAALAAVAYCKVDTICKDKDFAMTAEGRTELVEKRVNEKLILKCPASSQALCIWYHEDRRIPTMYGKKVEINSKGSLSINRLETRHSGTYTVEVSGRRIVYNLVVIPKGLVDLRDDLRQRLERDPSTDELKEETFEKKYLYNTVIRDIRISNVHFVDTFLHKVEFINVDFLNVTFRWTEKIPNRVSFTGCNFENVRWENALLEKSQFKKCRWVEKDDTRVTFKNPCIRDTVFCENIWLGTRWEDGEVYNTTFIKNRFDRHSFRKTKFLNFHVDRVRCQDIEAGMIIIDWEMNVPTCWAYVHKKNTDLKRECEVREKNDKKRCEFYASVKFLECNLRRVVMEDIELRAVEWRRTTFEECQLRTSLIEENYFTICKWRRNTFERVNVAKFSRFLANKFNEDDLRFISSDLLWFHSCKFVSVKMRWATSSRRIHLEKCIGDRMEFTGNHEIFRFVDTVMTDTKMSTSTIAVLEHCNTMIDEIEMIDTTVEETKEICDSEWPIEDCKDTWQRNGMVHEDDKCKRDILRWCKKEVNRRHPICFPFTRPTHRVCCLEKVNWKCDSWRWWRSTDFKCDCEKNTRFDILKREDDRLDREFVIKDCVERMTLEREARREYTVKDIRRNDRMEEREDMNEREDRNEREDMEPRRDVRDKRRNLWIRDLKRNVVTEQDKFPRVEKEICSQVKIFEAKKCCRNTNLEVNEKERCCRDVRMRVDRCDREFEEKERLDRFKEDLERNTFCICSDRE